MEKHHAGYRKQFFNLCGIILRHVLIWMLLDGDMSCERLEEIVAEKEAAELELMLTKTLHRLVAEEYEGDEQLEQYLQHECKDFSYDLINGMRYGYLEKCVVML